MVGSCERVNDPSSCIKDGEYLDQLRDYQLLKRAMVHGDSLHEYL
jgi:hypothetical protein